MINCQYIDLFKLNEIIIDVVFIEIHIFDTKDDKKGR